MIRSFDIIWQGQPARQCGTDLTLGHAPANWSYLELQKLPVQGDSIVRFLVFETDVFVLVNSPDEVLTALIYSQHYANFFPQLLARKYGLMQPLSQVVSAMPFEQLLGFSGNHYSEIASSLFR